MTASADKVDVYIENGQKRSLAVAVDWPGWCRSGKDAEAALEALFQAAPRYEQILERAGLSFRAPDDVSGLQVREHVQGGGGTDMAVPSIVLASDVEPMSDTEVERAVALLRACWDAFDRAIASARGKELRKGPRGGGRELEGMVRHVTEAEAAYVGQVGLKFKSGDLAEVAEALAASRERVLEGLTAVAQIGTPPPGPRGGARWPARYFVRRIAYHVVDHTWEIEDRLQSCE